MGQVYNIGSGVGRSNMDVLDVVRPLAERHGLGIQTCILPERPFDVPVNILDSGKLRAISGWLPRISFEEGILRIWSYFLNRPDPQKGSIR